jgi:hypothetical protein
MRIDEMDPKQWLEHVRESHGANRAFSADLDLLDDYLTRIPPQHKEAARTVWMSRFDTSISDIHDELIQMYFAQIIPVLNAKEKSIVDKLYFGIFPTHEFNAYAGATPRGDSVVILHEGLGHLLAYWSHWISRLAIDEDGRDYLRSSPEQ